MLSKNNRKLQERKLEQKQRFGFRKYSFGLASALIGVSFMLTTGGTVSADTTTSTSRDATNITASSESTDTKSLEATDTAPTTATTDSSDTKTENTTSETSDSKSESTTTGSATDTPNTASTESTSSENKASTATGDSSTHRSASSVTSVLLAAATDASANKTDANATTTTDDAASAEGKITDEGKAKGLTDSDVTPGMSDANGASLKADNSNIPDGYKADPTEDRYTFGIISLGGDYDKWGIDNSKYKSYNGENNTHYYIRLSTKKTATDGTYDDTVYAQVVDATTDTVKWNQTLTPNSGAVKINNGTDGFGLSSLVNNVTQYYEINYSNTKIGNTFTPRIAINPNNGSLTSLVVYNNGKAVTAGTASPGTYVSVLYPTTGTIETEYIAKDAHNNETTLATYEETGRQGYTYTISGPRVIKGYDLISSPSTTTGTLAKTYNVGDVYGGGNLVLSDQLQLARVYVVTSNDGYAKVELRVALQKDADGKAITLDSVNDSSIWKTILSTDSLAPGAYGSNGNYGSGTSWYINSTNGTKYITDAGFTEEQLAGYKKHLTVIVLANGLTAGQEPAKYYYAKLGKIVPVDPNGNPIPGADTPTYKNDPDDPSKVVPNEPTPEVPSTPDTPSTPEVPSTPDTPSTPEVPSTPDTPSTPEVPSTPGTPSNPEEPTTPDTPSNPETPTTPDKPEVPSQPQKPVTPSVQNNPTPVNPTTTPASPKQTTLTGKQSPAPSKTVTANQLPQTGADKEKVILLSALGLGLVTLTSLLGLLGDKKRKH